MSILEIIAGALLLVVSIVIVIVVLLQEGRNANISGAISGAADTFFDKNKARTIDSILAKWTKIIAIGFFVLTLATTVLMILGSKTPA